MIISKIELFNWKTFTDVRLECKSGALLWERMLQENPTLSMHFAFCGCC